MEAPGHVPSVPSPKSGTDRCAPSPAAKQIVEMEPKKTVALSLPLFPFVRGEVLPTTSSPPHLIVFSILLCLLSSFYSRSPLLPSAHLS